MRAEALPQTELDNVPGKCGRRGRLRWIGPRALAGWCVGLSAALSVAILAVRNLYDDELLSLYLPTGSIRDILAVTAEGDVHPPGMYLLGHAGWLLTHSYRWLNLLPMGILYLGLAVFLVSVVPLVRSRGGQVCMLLLAALHPELLMWSNTFRWYCPWTGLALITLTAALQPGRREPEISAARGLALGCLLGLMFYVNYITLLFGLVLLVASAVRYGMIGLKTKAGAVGVAMGTFGLLALPQVRTMVTVHLVYGRAQRYGLPVSVVRTVQAMGQSEAFLPWHPVAVLAFLALGVVAVGGLGAVMRSVGRASAMPETIRRSLGGIALFSVVFCVLFALSGLGGKPRSGLLLIPVLAPLAAVGLERLGPRLQGLVLLLLAAWTTIGAAHLLGRYGLVKAGMNDRPEEVVAFVQESLRRKPSTSNAESTCAVVVVYDSGLAFRLAQANIARLRIVSPYGGALFGASAEGLAEGCVQPRLYVVESYIDGTPEYVDAYTSELHAAEGFLKAGRSVQAFDEDADARRKHRVATLLRISSAGRLPDFRYVVVSGVMDGARYREMIAALPHFYGVQR